MRVAAQSERRLGALLAASPAMAGTLAAIVAIVTALAGAVGAHAQAPEVGGAVPSVLSLSLGQSSGFSVDGRSLRRAKHGGHVYSATIELTVTATDTPTRLGIADGEAMAGKRDGHMVDGEKILSPALEVSVAGGPYRSLAGPVEPQLDEWRQPLADRLVSIHLRQLYMGTAKSLARFHKLLLVTATAGGP
jgi:hypothetical protein